MERLYKLWKNSAFRSYFAIAGSILLGVAIIAFCVTSAINNNHTAHTAVVTTRDIAAEHNNKVDELAEKNNQFLKNPKYYTETEPAPSGFKLTVIDVGQGLSCLIECDGYRMLYDGGDRDTSSFLVSYITKTKGISYLDYVVASHYHSDHIAGLIGILKTTKVGCVMGAPYINDTKTYLSFESAAKLKGGIYYPTAGEIFSLGSAQCEVVSPQPNHPFNSNDDEEDENRMSVGLRITYGDTSYLLMGDATADEEEESVDAGGSRPTEVLIVNHHGSASSTSEKFVQCVQPQISVISCGLENEYGHPADIVISRLEGSLVYRTDYDGTIEIVSDGVNIDVYTEK